MNPSHPPVTPLSPLEVSGALCPRVIHDLSSLISGIIGNAEYARRPGLDAVNLEKALQAISVSASSAANLIVECLPLQRAVQQSSFPFETFGQAGLIAECAGLAPGWQVVVPPELAGRIFVQPSWLAATVMQIAREADASSGEIQFSCGSVVYPVAWSGSKQESGQPPQLFQIHMSYRGAQPMFPLSKQIAPEKSGLQAASELIRRFKGQIHARPKPPGRQEITILLPLI